MALIAKGVGKRTSYKKEGSGWGVLAGDTGGKTLRRVTTDFNLTKEAYESNEIRVDYQTADFRHGVRSVEGTINGELSPSSYSDFIQSILTRDFTTGGTTSSASITIATSGALFTITRGTGSWLSDGFYVGNIVRLTGAGLNTANVGNNLLITALSATVMTVQVLSSTPLVAEGPISSVGAAIVGKHTYIPLTGHTDDSYTVEDWYSDISQSEVFTGCKASSIALQLPSTGLVTTDISFMGKDLAQTDTSEYFTTPTAAGTDGIFASVQGALIVNGTPVSLITSLDFTVNRNIEPATVVGSNTAADMFVGRISVTGTFSTYFENGTFRDYFNDETVVSLVVALTTSEDKNADAMSFVFPKIKVNSATKADAELGIIQEQSFQALLNDVTTAGLIESTILVQDTTL